MTDGEQRPRSALKIKRRYGWSVHGCPSGFGVASEPMNALIALSSVKPTEPLPLMSKRLSCRNFEDNQTRLHLFALA